MNRLATRCLQVRLLDTWHVGSGRAAGRHLDAVVERDPHGLPYLPGRAMKGLLREAAVHLEAWGHWPPGTVERLFGSVARRAGEPSRPGLVRVGSAELPPAERAWLAGDHPDAARHRAALFMEQFQTAIDADTGIAADGTLRGIECVVPVTLQAEIALDAAADALPTADDWQRLTQLLPLVRAVGAHRTRGHGRAELTWIAEDAR